MADDDFFSPPQPDTGAAPRRLWPTVSRWWASTSTPADAALGYESAQPWTQDDTPEGELPE
jgi:hypothetical protein